MSSAKLINDLSSADEGRELRGAINAALEISARRRDTLDRLRDALQNNNTDEALSLARQLCGLETDATCNRTHSRIN